MGSIPVHGRCDNERVNERKQAEDDLLVRQSYMERLGWLGEFIGAPRYNTVHVVRSPGQSRRAAPGAVRLTTLRTNLPRTRRILLRLATLESSFQVESINRGASSSYRRRSSTSIIGPAGHLREHDDGSLSVRQHVQRVPNGIGVGVVPATVT